MYALKVHPLIEASIARWHASLRLIFQFILFLSLLLLLLSFSLSFRICFRPPVSVSSSQISFAHGHAHARTHARMRQTHQETGKAHTQTSTHLIVVSILFFAADKSVPQKLSPTFACVSNNMNGL